MLLNMRRIPSNVPHLYIDERGRLRANSFYTDVTVSVEIKDEKISEEEIFEALNRDIKTFAPISKTYEGKIFFISGWSSPENFIYSLTENDKPFESAYLKVTGEEKNRFIILKSPDVNTRNYHYVNAIQDYIKSRLELFIIDNDYTVEILDVKIYNSMPTADAFSFVTIPLINRHGELTAKEIYFAVDEYTEDYNPNCETCKLAFKHLRESIAANNLCIAYNEDYLEKKGFFNTADEWYTLISDDVDGDEEKGTIQISNANQKRIPIGENHDDVGIISIGKRIAEENRTLLNDAKISRLRVFTKDDLGFIIKIERYQSTDFVF